MITGGSDGLGLEYASQLGAKGFNLVLVARSQEKLEAAKKKLGEENKDIDIKTIVFDFNIPYTAEGYASLKEELEKLEDVSILINNVGALSFGNFNDMDIEDMNRMIQVNCIPQVVVTKYLLPKLLKRSIDEGKRGAIINLSSVANYTNLSKTAVYVATKSYNLSLSKVLSKEYGKHLDIMGVLPGPTRTNMITFDAPLVIKPHQHVRWALSDLGYNIQTFGHYKHWIYCNAYRYPLWESWYNALRQRLIKEMEAKKEQKTQK